MITLAEIAAALEETAPLTLQEPYDNTGWQVLARPAATACTGVLTCVDVTPAVVDEASALGYNLIVSHHPVLFRGVKQLVGATQPQRVVAQAIARGISIYSCHTAIDSARHGVSAQLAHRLGLTSVEVLEPKAADPHCGLGAIGTLPEPLTAIELAAKVKSAYASPVVRCSALMPHAPISVVALCGGSGSDLIPSAIARGAQAFVTSDTSHHAFVDFSPEIFIIDTGHFEAEKCTNDIFYHIIKEKFHNFAVTSAKADVNPIIYL